MIRKMLSSMKPAYIGTVTATTIVTTNDGSVKLCQKTGRWILTTGLFNRRRAKLVGDPGGSGFANDQKARVKAWQAGGPLPPLDSETQHKPKQTAKILKLVSNNE